MTFTIGSAIARCSRSFVIRRHFHISNIDKMPIKVGDKLPDVDLFEDTPANKVNLAKTYATKKVVIFAVPGAFTPGCSKTHLPGYVENFSKIKSKGVDSIICISVNDPFVMEAWGKDQKAEGKVRMLADTCGAFTKAVDMELHAQDLLGNIRSKRYAMIVENGEVKAIEVEPDGKGLTCTLAASIIDKL